MIESAIRLLVRQLQASSDVDDSERAALGITVPDTTPTESTGGIDTRPIGAVDTSQRLRHEIRFSDEATPTRRAKPAGVMGCEIWVKVAAPSDPPPTGADDLSFVTLDTASPYIVEYDGADGGKTAHYMLRWVKVRRRKRPLVGNHQCHDHGVILAGSAINTNRPAPRPRNWNIGLKPSNVGGENAPFNSAAAVL